MPQHAHLGAENFTSFHFLHFHFLIRTLQLIDTNIDAILVFYLLYQQCTDVIYDYKKNEG